MYSSLTTSVELTGLLLLLAGTLCFWIVSFAADCKRVGTSGFSAADEDRKGVEIKRSLAHQYIAPRVHQMSHSAPQRLFNSRTV